MTLADIHALVAILGPFAVICAVIGFASSR